MITPAPDLSLWSGLGVYSELTRTEPERLKQALREGKSLLVLGGLRPPSAIPTLRPPARLSGVDYRLFAVLPSPIELREGESIAEELLSYHAGFRMMSPYGIYRLVPKRTVSVEDLPGLLESSGPEEAFRVPIEPTEVPAVIVAPWHVDEQWMERVQEVLDKIVVQHYKEVGPAVFATMGMFRLYEGEQLETGTEGRGPVFRYVLPAWHPFDMRPSSPHHMETRSPLGQSVIGESSYLLFTRLPGREGIVAPPEGAHEIDLEQGEVRWPERRVRVSVPSKMLAGTVMGVSSFSDPMWFSHQLRQMGELFGSGKSDIEVRISEGVQGLMDMILTESPVGANAVLSCVSAPGVLTEHSIGRFAFFHVHPEPMLALGVAKPEGRLAAYSGMPYVGRATVYHTVLGEKVGVTAYRVASIGGTRVPEPLRKEIEKQMMYHLVKQGVAPIQIFPSSVAAEYNRNVPAGWTTVSEDVRFLSPAISAAQLVRTGGELGRVLGTQIYMEGRPVEYMFDYKGETALPYLDTLAIPGVLLTERDVQSAGGGGGVIPAPRVGLTMATSPLGNYLLGFIFPEGLATVIGRHEELYKPIYGAPIKGTEEKVTELAESLFPQHALANLAEQLSRATGMVIEPGGGAGERIYLVPSLGPLRMRSFGLRPPDILPKVEHSGVAWPAYAGMPWGELEGKHELLLPLPLRIKKASWVQGTEKFVFAGFGVPENTDLAERVRLRMDLIKKELPALRLLFSVPTGMEPPDWLEPIRGTEATLFGVAKEKLMNPEDIRTGRVTFLGAVHPEMEQKLLQRYGPSTLFGAISQLISGSGRYVSYLSLAKYGFSELALAEMGTRHHRSLLGILGRMSATREYLEGQGTEQGVLPIDEGFYERLRQSFVELFGRGNEEAGAYYMARPALFAYDSALRALEYLGEINPIKDVLYYGAPPSAYSFESTLPRLTAAIIDAISGGKEREYAKQVMRVAGMTQHLTFIPHPASSGIYSSPLIRLEVPGLPRTAETSSQFVYVAHPLVRPVSTPSVTEEAQPVLESWAQTMESALGSSSWRGTVSAAIGQAVPVFFEEASVEYGRIAQELIVPVTGEKQPVRFRTGKGRDISIPRNLVLARIAAGTIAGSDIFPPGASEEAYRIIGMSPFDAPEILPLVTTAQQRVDLLSFLRSPDAYRQGLVIPVSYESEHGAFFRSSSEAGVQRWTPQSAKALLLSQGGEVHEVYAEESWGNVRLMDALRSAGYIEYAAPLPAELQPLLESRVPSALVWDLSKVPIPIPRPKGLVAFLPYSSVTWGSVLGSGVGARAPQAPGEGESRYKLIPKTVMLYYPGESEKRAPFIAHVISQRLTHGVDPSEVEPPLFRVYKIESGSLVPEVVARQKPLAYIKKAFGKPLDIREALSELSSRLLEGKLKPEQGIMLMAFGGYEPELSSPKGAGQLLTQAQHAVSATGSKAPVSLLVAHPEEGQTHGLALFEKLPLLAPYTVSALSSPEPGFWAQFGHYGRPIAMPIGLLIGPESWQKQIVSGIRARAAEHYKQSVPAFLGAIASTKSSSANVLGVMPVAVRGHPEGEAVPSLAPIAIRSLFAVMDPSGTLYSIREGFFTGESALEAVIGNKVVKFGQLGFPHASVQAEAEAPLGSGTRIPEWYGRSIVETWKQVVGAVPQQLQLRAEAGKPALLSFVQHEVCNMRPISCMSFVAPDYGIGFGSQGIWFTGESSRTVFPKLRPADVGAATPQLLLGSPLSASQGTRPPHDIRATLHITPGGYRLIEDVYGNLQFALEGTTQQKIRAQQWMAEAGMRAYSQAGFIPVRLLSYMERYWPGSPEELRPGEYLSAEAPPELAQRMLPMVGSFIPLSLGEGYPEALSAAIRAARSMPEEVLARLRRENLPVALGMAGDWRYPNVAFMYLDFPVLAGVRVAGAKPDSPVEASSAIAGALAELEPGTERIALSFTPLMMTSLLRYAEAEQRGGGGPVEREVTSYLKTVLPPAKSKESWVGFVPLQTVPHVFGEEPDLRVRNTRSLWGKVNLAYVSGHPIVTLKLD